MSYNQQFNKQLASKLQYFRQKHPNSIPVYAMKYKNASKYFIQDLQQPLALCPKKFKLQTIYKIIQQQSLNYCKNKLKDDPKVKLQGQNFKLPTFYLYTIEVEKEEDNKKNQQNPNNKKEQNKSNKPIGRFVKLDLQMTYEEAFQKFGRQNVLTIVYTDATKSRMKESSPNNSVQKWLTRLLIFILLLVIVPFLMKDQQNKIQSPLQNQTQPKTKKHSTSNEIRLEDLVELDDSGFHSTDQETNSQEKVFYQSDQF